MAGGSNAGWITMEEVAREAGVSTMTVSRALKTPDKVAVATRERVASAVRRLGYVPDRVAGALSSGESRLVAALLSTIAGSIFADTVAGLSASLAEGGYQLLLGTTDYSPANEEALIATALGRRPDGLVLTSGVHTEGARRSLQRAGLPVLELWDLPEHPIDMAVGFSNRDAGRRMTSFLHELGYHRIAITGSFGDRDHRGLQRQEGYVRALRDAGLGSPRIVLGDERHTSIEAGAIGLQRVRERWPDTDAIFCTSDAVALGALAEARRGSLEVPRDIAIAGFGDFEYAGPTGLDITTLRVPGRTIGREAGRLLIARRRGEIMEPVVLDVGFEPVRRGTA